MEVDPVHVLQLSSQSSGVPLTSQKEVLRFVRVYRDPETISDLDSPRSNLTWIWDVDAFLRGFFEWPIVGEANHKSDTLFKLEGYIHDTFTYSHVYVTNGNCLVLCGDIMFHDGLFRRQTLIHGKLDIYLNYVSTLNHIDFCLKFAIKSLVSRLLWSAIIHAVDETDSANFISWAYNKPYRSL